MPLQIDWKVVAKQFLTSRIIDTIEEKELAPQGKILYQFSSTGHELAQIMMAQFLTNPHDCATVYYRSRPFVLAAGMTIEESFAGGFASKFSRNGGRDIGVVHNLVPRNGVTVLSASGDVGAQFTPAVGWAQAVTYRASVMNDSSWNESIAVSFSGDAACATNGFWAALTIATTQNFPMLFFVEDNSFGISVTGDFQTPGGNIAKNLASFTNLKIIECDGTNAEELANKIDEAVIHLRARKSPVLFRAVVPRICGHSGADSQQYKTKEQREYELNNDPLDKLQSYLIKKKVFTKKSWEELVTSVEAEVRRGAEAALAQPDPDLNSVLDHVFYQGDSQIVGGLLPENISFPATTDIPETSGSRMNLINAVRKTLEVELATNNRVMVFGEDVGKKGGVHGATIDLQHNFGSSRVFDTSLSEEGIIGRAVGLASAGLMPVPEIQFRKYLDPAMEQLNDCGTIRWRTNNQFASPMVVRIPVGHSKRTGDPWHSVSGEAIFAHTIGWKVAMPSNAADAVGLLRTALRGNDPVLFLEHRNLLDTSAGRSPYPGDNYAIPFGKADIVATGTQATIVTWGECVSRAKQVAEMTGLSIEIIDLRTITPWDKEAVLQSVRKTNRVMILHEDTITAGFGAEIAAVIAQEAFNYLDAPVDRFATPDIPIPYNLRLMDVVIPSVKDIAERVKTLVNY